jgi:MFS family permease
VSIFFRMPGWAPGRGWATRWVRLARQPNGGPFHPQVPPWSLPSRTCWQRDRGQTLARCIGPVPDQQRLYSTKDDPPAGKEHTSVFRALRNVLAALTPAQRRQLLILTTAGAVLNLSFGVVLPAFPTLSADLGLGASGVSLLLALPSATRLLFNIPMGRHADRSGRVPLMVLGECLAGIGVAGTGLATSLPLILCARLLVGLGGAMASAGSHAYLADLTHAPNVRPHRAFIMGLQSAATNAAWVAGPAIGGLACELYGPRLGFLLVGAVTALCGAAYATLPESLDRKPTAPGQPTPSLLGIGALRTLLASPTQRGVMAAHFALTMNYAAMTVVLPLHAAVVWGATAGHIGALFSAVSILSVLFSPISGTLADHYGRMKVILPSLALMAAGCAGLGVAGGLTSFVIPVVVWTIGEAFFVPTTSALTADCAPPDKKGETLALSRQVGDMGFALGPIILGLMYDTVGPIVTLGAMGLVNIGTALYMAARVTETPAPHRPPPPSVDLRAD